MKAVTTAEAKSNLSALLKEASVSHEPIQIKGRTTRGVLISAEDWSAIQETLYLLSIPGMRESIVAGMKTPIGKCSRDDGECCPAPVASHGLPDPNRHQCQGN